MAKDWPAYEKVLTERRKGSSWRDVGKALGMSGTNAKMKYKILCAAIMTGYHTTPSVYLNIEERQRVTKELEEGHWGWMVERAKVGLSAGVMNCIASALSYKDGKWTRLYEPIDWDKAPHLIAAKTEWELMRVPGLGPTTVGKIKKWLRRYNLTLSGSSRIDWPERPVLTYTIAIDEQGNIYNDVQTHDRTFAEVYKAFHTVRDEVNRQINQRRTCPYNPISVK